MGFRKLETSKQDLETDRLDTTFALTSDIKPAVLIGGWMQLRAPLDLTANRKKCVP